MANQHKHPLRCVRGVDDELWTDLDAAAKSAGEDRSSISRRLWEWYVRRPGAKLPERPESEGDE